MPANNYLLAIDSEANGPNVILILTEPLRNQLPHILAGRLIRVEVLGIETLVTEFNKVHFLFLLRR
jgi:hypothetical protein